MIKIYVSLCENGKKNIFQVPSSIRDKVIAQIQEDGYTILEDGNVIIAPIGK